MCRALLALSARRDRGRGQSARAAVVPAMLIAFAGVVPGAMADDDWQTAGGGDWSNPANWSTGLPGPGDDVFNLLFGAPISFNTNATIQSFLSNSDLTLYGGTLAGSLPSDGSTLQVNGALTFNGGGLSNFTVQPGTGGTVTFDSNGNNFLSAVTFNSDVSMPDGGFVQLYNANTVNGAVNMASNSNGIDLHDGNASLYVGSTGTLHGYGSVYQVYNGATVSSDGLVSADVAGSTLALNVSNITGGGTFQGIGGGTLAIGGLFNGNNSTVVHADTGTVLVNGGGLTGTFAAATGTGFTFANNGNNYMSSAVVNGNLTFPEGGYAQLYNANTVNGVVAMASNSNGIQLHDGNASLTIGATGELHGYGTVYQVYGGTTLTVNGVASADVSATTLALNTSYITGSGTLDARNGGVLSIGGQLIGSGMQANVDPTTASAIVVSGGGINGVLGATTGSGISFGNNGGNTIGAVSSTTVNGTISFPNGGYAQLYNFNTVNGSVVMSSFSNGLQLHDGNATLYVSSTGTLHGYGTVYQVYGGTTVSSDGLVSADAGGTSLTLNVSNITGGGVFQAVNGGTLAIGGQFSGSNATVHGDTGTVLVDGGGVTGSFAAATGTGFTFANNGNNYLSSSVVNGNLTFPDGGYAQVYNANTVNGVVAMASNSNGIQLHDGNASLTIGATGELHGYGTVYQVYGGTTLTVNGVASADVGGTTLALNTSNITGNGTFQGVSGGTLSIGGQLSGSNASVHGDTGTVLVNGGGLTGTFAAATGSGFTFASNGNNYISAATINGNLTFPNGGYAQVYNANTVNGIIAMSSTSNGIQLHDGNASLTIGPAGTLRGYGSVYQVYGGTSVVNQGMITADTAGQNLGLNVSTVTNSGSVLVRSGAALSYGGFFTQTAGTTQVDGQLFAATTMQLLSGTLLGNGSFVGSVNNAAGAINPGSLIGQLTVTGAYSQGSGASFVENLGGYAAGTQFSQLLVNGGAALDGTLSVALQNGFVPLPGDQFTILLGAVGSTTFASLTSPDPGLTYTAQYFSDHVTITILTVPAPSTTLLLLLAGCSAVRRRRAVQGRIDPA